MADTLEEALRLASNEETVSPIVIRNDLRTITLPANFVIGVYNDKDVHSIPVEMPRYFKGLDLSEFSIRVNFVGPSGVKDRYLVTDANVEEDKITFHWLVGRNAFLKEGTLTFNFCLRKMNEGVVEKEFNTTIIKTPVLVGLETDATPTPEQIDYITAAIEALNKSAPIPSLPTEDGNYILRCEVINGEPYLSWTLIAETMIQHSQIL